RQGDRSVPPGARGGSSQPLSSQPSRRGTATQARAPPPRRRHGEKGITKLTAGVVLALTLAQAPRATPLRVGPETDETGPVQRRTRLTINNFAGEVVIHSWDKDQVHVLARHQARTQVSIHNNGTVVLISASGTRGRQGSVDYDITAPAWMPIRTEGTYNFVTMEGVRAEVFANTVRGDVVIKGGTGTITAKSVEGEVNVEGARGKVNVSSVNEKIHVTNSTGEIVADSVNGSITMTGMDATSVDASSVNGTITYEGRIADGGHYSFETHNGDLLLGIPENA